MLPDTKVLSNRRKRPFKTAIMEKLNQLLDVEEAGEQTDMNIPSQPAVGDLQCHNMVESCTIQLCDLHQLAAEEVVINTNQNQRPSMFLILQPCLLYTSRCV